MISARGEACLGPETGSTKRRDLNLRSVPSGKLRSRMPPSAKIILHVIPSPLGISWESPRALFISALGNHVAAQSFKRGHGIGHVHVEICGDGRPPALTGISGEGFDEYYREIFARKSGLGVLFHQFRGRLESPEEIDDSLRRARRQDRWVAREFNVTVDGAAAARAHLAQFEARRDDLRYGFRCDPMSFEGAGCTAFAISFLQVAGVKIDELAHWRRRVFIPNELISDELHPTTPKVVPAWKVLTDPAASAWAPPSQGQELEFWCPDLMARLATDKSRASLQGQSRSGYWPFRRTTPIPKPRSR